MVSRALAAFAGLFILFNGLVAHAAEGDSSPAPGPEVAARFSRPTLPFRACSFEAPICVHGKDPEPILRTLSIAEKALVAITRGLRLPAPQASAATGAFDIYLTDDLRDPWDASFGERMLSSATDRASSYAKVNARLHERCAHEMAVTGAMLRGSLFSAAPATDESTAIAEVASLATLLVPCAQTLLTENVARFQKTPELAISDSAVRAEGDDHIRARERAYGASLFYSWLDWSYAREPGGMAMGLWALRPTFTPFGASYFVGKPDVFDVLKESFKGALFSDSLVEDLYLDFAVARAFMGSADDGQHFPESRAFGAAASLSPEWTIDWPEKPRRLAPRAPLFPTGSSCIVVNAEGAKQHQRLRVEAEWETHSKMRWTIVRVGKAGNELGRIDLRAQDRATNAQATVVDLRDATRLILVGMNGGDFSHPFDPDDAFTEPHNWLVTVGVE